MLIRKDRLKKYIRKGGDFMIKFDNLPLDPGTLISLEKIDIDFIFQPIFQLSTGSIIAHEALISPNESAAHTIIDEYEANTKLHVLELAALFGATKRFIERGYSTKLCINSFASEILTPLEADVYFGNIAKTLNGRLIVDLLDHNFYSPLTWQIKRNQLRSHNATIVLADFTPNYDHIHAFNVFEPDFVKLDRIYIDNIARDNDQQDRLRKVVNHYHRLGAKVMVEGVETVDELEVIKRTDIDFAQGNYLGKPE